MQPTGQSTGSSAIVPANGASTPHDLFILTDEQILEIEPEGEVNVPPGFSPVSSPPSEEGSLTVPLPGASSQRVVLSEPPASEGSQPQRDRSASDDEILRDAKTASPRMTQQPSATEHRSRDTVHETQAGALAAQEPPPWLAAQMKDPWSGEEAKEFWNGVQQARSEAAAYRATFATPEDARALKELYPGGVNEAREATTRARLLDEIDRAYFGVPGGSVEQTRATRADLAQRMLREDPAAFREMVFAGLRALEAAEKGIASPAGASNLPRLAQVVSPREAAVNVAPRFSSASSTFSGQAEGVSTQNDVEARPASGPEHGSLDTDHESPVTNRQSLSAYAAFEKSANEDLERSVGGAIAHTIEQALPNLKGSNSGGKEGARHGVPLQDRLSAAVRQDVEAALKGDRQLGEQIAQILSARRFDNETRAQVVRLIDDRARQLVPGAARRVINDWTQTTLAAHRGNAARANSASTRREVEPVAAQGSASQGLPVNQAGPGAFSSRAAQTRPGAESNRSAMRSDSRRLDYRKLSDEQILDM